MPKVRPPVPWRHLLTSPPVYSIILCQVCLKCASHLMLIYAPLYTMTGLIVGVPPLMSGFCTPLSGIIADSRYGRQTRSTTVVRKTLNTIGFFGLAACYTLLAASTSLGMSLASFCIAGVFYGTCTGGGFNVNPFRPVTSFRWTYQRHLHMLRTAGRVHLGRHCGGDDKTQDDPRMVLSVHRGVVYARGGRYRLPGLRQRGRAAWARGEPDKKTLTFASPQGPPDMKKSGFTRTNLTVQGRVEEDYTVHDDFIRSSDEEEFPLEEEEKVERFGGR
ncbi:hypothetical protein Bbelb_226630 [Branchiostoma belcheri]|nr:hypothetical protein Bbelb_226630 [Branchiostoma belcheri]